MTKQKNAKKTKKPKINFFKKNIYFFVLVFLIAFVFILTLSVINKNTIETSQNTDKIFNTPEPEKITADEQKKYSEEITSDYPIDAFSTKEDFLGKPSVIYFAGTYCGACKANVPGLKEKIWDNYKLEANIWLQVINDDTFDVDMSQGLNKNIDMREFLKNCNYIPSFVVLDKEGKTTLESCGSQKTTDDIKEELDRLLN
jgi:thiol-disulfide isomerase/thioredoxin